MKFVHINLSIFLKTLFIAYFLYSVHLTGSLSFCLILFSPNTCFSISTNDVDVFFWSLCTYFFYVDVIINGWWKKKIIDCSILKYRKCVNCIILLRFAILSDCWISAFLSIHIIWQGTKCSFSQKLWPKKTWVKNVWAKNVLGESLGNHENIYLSIVTS